MFSILVFYEIFGKTLYGFVQMKVSDVIFISGLIIHRFIKNATRQPPTPTFK